MKRYVAGAGLSTASSVFAALTPLAHRRIVLLAFAVHLHFTFAASAPFQHLIRAVGDTGVIVRLCAAQLLPAARQPLQWLFSSATTHGGVVCALDGRSYLKAGWPAKKAAQKTPAPA